MLLFSARALHKHYAAGVPGCSAVARVLSGITLELATGQLVGIVGRRASGKTTLLRCVAGLARPDAGALHWEDCARRPRFVSVSVAAYPFDTVGDVIGRGLNESAVDPTRLESLLDLFGLQGSLDKAQFALTTCERARLALAVSLAAASSLMLLDGTPDALSDAWRPVVREALATHAATGGAVLLAGRDMPGVAALAHSVLELRDGRLEAPGRERDRQPPARVAEANARGIIR